MNLQPESRKGAGAPSVSAPVGVVTGVLMIVTCSVGAVLVAFVQTGAL